MMYAYGLYHGELGEHFLVLTDYTWCVRAGAHCMVDRHHRIMGIMAEKKYVVWLRENGKKCFEWVLHNVFIVWY